jgi:hypothetical protein
VIVAGEIAYDYGFYEGYFLYDLFFKSVTEQTYTESYPLLVPLLIIAGPYDYSQMDVNLEDLVDDLNINVFFPQ